jgi:hypothetical protein
MFVIQPGERIRGSSSTSIILPLLHFGQLNTSKPVSLFKRSGAGSLTLTFILSFIPSTLALKRLL